MELQPFMETKQLKQSKEITTIFSFRREGRFLSHRVNEASESKGVLIKAGEYNFPFTFQIPQKVPPSCIYKNGKVLLKCSVYKLFSR